jgi:cytochrome c-type biogenesis protein CcmF
MEPSRRTFPSRNMATTEAALMRRGVSQIYLSLGDPAADGSVPVRLYFKPLVLLIWLGALIMFVGGGLSLSDARLQVGSLKSARRHEQERKNLTADGPKIGLARVQRAMSPQLDKIRGSRH